MHEAIEHTDGHREETHPLWAAREQLARHGRKGFGVVEMYQIPTDVREFLSWIIGEVKGAEELPGAIALEQKYFDGDPFTDDERAMLEGWYAQYAHRRAA